MRRIAVWILIIGLGFAFFRLPFAGVDLLIDAVGWLLAWNALRPLARKENTFGISAPLCLALVAVSALQLFFTGGLSTALALLRCGLEIALFAMVARGFGLVLRREGHEADARLAALCFGLCMAASLCVFTLVLWPSAPAVAAMALTFFAGAAHVALLACLARLGHVLKDA